MADRLPQAVFQLLVTRPGATAEDAPSEESLYFTEAQYPDAVVQFAHRIEDLNAAEDSAGTSVSVVRLADDAITSHLTVLTWTKYGESAGKFVDGEKKIETLLAAFAPAPVSPEE